jgi:hypothetical protein
VRKVTCWLACIPLGEHVSARGHFPTETAALMCVYLAIMSLDPTGKGQERWSSRCKAALNAFEIAFEGRRRLPVEPQNQLHR